MIIRGRFRNGVIVPDESVDLPDGTTVRIEVINAEPQKSAPRCGGLWKGRIVVADDFDALPCDLGDAFGMSSIEPR